VGSGGDDRVRAAELDLERDLPVTGVDFLLASRCF
jgi:hypothetical protein